MRFVSQTLNIPAAVTESLEIIVDGTEWDACFFTDLLRGFLALQDGADLHCSTALFHNLLDRIVNPDVRKSPL